MYSKEQELDAFNKIKELSDKHDLNISDKEIYDWINDIVITEEMKESAKERLKNINNNLGTNFNLNTNILDILKVISDKWKSL